MAVTVDELVLKITLSNEKTATELGKINSELEGLKKSTKSASDGVSGTSASFAKFAIIGTAAINTISSLISTISGLTESFFDAEDAVTRLRQALEITGSTSIQATVDQFSKLGDSIESMGVASTEQVLALARLGTAADQSAEQTERLIKAAADLSVARGIPLESAFKALSNSLKGSSGALANFLPELSNLTEEQNKAGFAINYVSASLGGFAAKNLETYSGKVAVLKTKFGDVGEEIGHIITDIFNLDEAVKGSTTYLGSLQNTLIQNRDTFVSIGKVMATPFIYLGDVIQGLIVSIGGTFGFLEMVAGKLILSFGQLQVWTDKLAKRSTSMGDAMIRTGNAMIESGKSYTTAAKEMIIATEPLKEVPKALEDTAVKAASAATALAEMKKQIMTKDQVAAYEELKKKVIELQGIQAAAGLVGADLIRAKAISDKNEIDILAKKIKLTGELTAEQSKAVQSAKGSIDSAAKLQIDKLHLDTLTEIQSKNNEIASATKSIDATRRETIQFELEKQLELLEIEKKKIDIQDKASLAAIERQKELLKAQAEKKAGSGTSAGFEGLQKIGTDTANKISGSFASGATGMIAGGASMIGAVVAAINTLLDLIPNMLNSIAGIFNKITDFPETLFNAFQGVFDSMVRFVSDFIPKLVESIFKSITQIKDFANNIANAITDLADKLPDIISNLIEKFPDMIVSLIENLAKAWLKILVAIYIKIPIAIIKGIISGISKLWEGIKRLFAGKSFLPKIKVDTTDVAKKIGSQLSGVSGRLFNVKDLTDAAKDPVKAMSGMVENSFRKGADWIKRAWMWVYEKIIQPIFEGLKAVWMFVWDKIIQPIFEGLKAVWMFIWDKILKPVIDAYKAVFNWINDNIFKPIINAYKAVFNWINDNIFKPFIDGIMSVFVWINDNIIAPISEAFMAVFAFIDEKVIQPLLSVGQKIAQPIIDAFKGIMSIFNSIGDALKSLFKLDFSGLKEAMSEVFSKGGELVKNAFKGVVNPIIQMFNGLIDLMNALVIPGVSWSVSAGRLGSWSGTLFDDIDLLPGTIKRLQTLADGGIVKSNGSPISGFGTDTVPAMLTPGEFVMSRPAVQTIGLDNLRAMNNGSSLGGSNTYNMSFEINVDAKTTMDEGYIRGTLIPRMSEELKRASLDGKFVLSQKGIR